MYKRKRSMSVRSRRPAKKIYRKRTLTAKRRSRALNKKIKSVILKTAERKAIGTLVNNANPIAVDLFNVRQLTNVVTTSGAAGEELWNRKVGQEYFLTGFNIKFMVSNVITTEGDPINPIYFRVMILEGLHKNGTIAPISGNAIFQGVDLTNVAFTAIANKPQSMWYPVDKTWYRTLYNKVIKVGNNGSFDTVNLQRYISCRRKIKTLMNNNGEGQQSHTHYLCFWAYDPGSSNATGQSYDCDYQHQTLFRDP